MNVTAQLEFELTYLVVTIQPVSHSDSSILLGKIGINEQETNTLVLADK